MTFWIVLNTVCSLIVAGILIYKLVCLITRFVMLERVGMGLLGAGMVLNIAPILNAGTPFAAAIDTPFDDWGSTLLRVGLALYFIGRMTRIWRHDRNNIEHAEMIERELALRARQPNRQR